ncbi:MAG: hypothetical protein HY736_06350 [Verrucomicrobia bacterium]|nr:hypothetical protein [Verrucomicrobiota bacterium]
MAASISAASGSGSSVSASETPCFTSSGNDRGELFDRDEPAGGTVAGGFGAEALDGPVRLFFRESIFLLHVVGGHDWHRAKSDHLMAKHHADFLASDGPLEPAAEILPSFGDSESLHARLYRVFFATRQVTGRLAKKGAERTEGAAAVDMA